MKRCWETDLLSSRESVESVQDKRQPPVDQPESGRQIVSDTRGGRVVARTLCALCWVGTAQCSVLYLLQACCTASAVSTVICSGPIKANTATSRRAFSPRLAGGGEPAGHMITVRR